MDSKSEKSVRPVRCCAKNCLVESVRSGLRNSRRGLGLRIGGCIFPLTVREERSLNFGMLKENRKNKPFSKFKTKERNKERESEGKCVYFNFFLTTSI